MNNDNQINKQRVKGYKVFNPNWTCRNKQYSCPGKFEEDINISVCEKGMHFCKKAADCFNYYSFDSENHVAEVIAYGDVEEEGDKCCTDKLEIVREIPWSELLDLVNMGKGCTGVGNSGNYNSGYHNSGNYNRGNYNSGNCNSGYHNSGYHNSGNCNSGNCNSGNYNSGYRNSGDYNSGNYNSGNCNSGNYNSGNYNSGNCNSGNYNSGNYNKTNYSNGWFNTKELKIPMFNKISEWTNEDAENSEANKILAFLAGNTCEWIYAKDMTDEEKRKHPEYETARGYLKSVDIWKDAVDKWRNLTEKEKDIVMSIPNFDKEIFRDITGIDVDVKDNEEQEG